MRHRPTLVVVLLLLAALFLMGCTNTITDPELVLIGPNECPPDTKVSYGTDADSVLRHVCIRERIE